MHIIESFIKLSSRAQSHLVVPIGDIHFGSRACDRKLLGQCIARIEELQKCQETSIILMGDNIESITTKDLRHDSDNVDWNIWLDSGGRMETYQMKCAEELARILRPIARNIVYVLEGNHERKTRNQYEIDTTSALIHNLRRYNPDIQGGAYEMVWCVHYQRLAHRRVVCFHFHHGTGGGKLVTTPWRNVFLLSQIITNAEIVIMGHAHQSGMMTTTSLEIHPRHHNPPNSRRKKPLSETPAPKLVARTRYLFLVPSFFRAYQTGKISSADIDRLDDLDNQKRYQWIMENISTDTYASVRMFPPSTLGAYGIAVSPFYHSGEQEQLLVNPVPIGVD